MISYTYRQATLASSTSQSLPISVSKPMHGQKRINTITQHCIRVAGGVVNRRSVHLMNFCGGGQLISLKSATALILDRHRQF